MAGFGGGGGVLPEDPDDPEDPDEPWLLLSDSPEEPEPFELDEDFSEALEEALLVVVVLVVSVEGSVMKGSATWVLCW